ncbi:MAG: His-Xaa-Ser system radical SAM maturase HxsC [Hylemonella sp.]|uniref:His-Xaa-Ser system radical SAM maturase HxsC n=1 Tax=Hylemonella sp. TaxID=2066020 RepID=UPI0022BE50BC|nr:His-Xaa-Ser system radical SAM maturase HxsC [Hylemonella sp.]MCZ8252137.1 His-Xaa-Ser system radical SAM maturase HxsC [Hylemonella sp.]
MLTLSGRVIRIESEAPKPLGLKRDGRGLYSLTTNADLPPGLRSQKALLVQDRFTDIPTGYSHYFAFGPKPEGFSGDWTVMGAEFGYLAEGDVVALSEGHLRSLFRANSEHNSILLTEQCNNYCLMCSQPPKRIDDKWLLDEAMDLVRLIPRDTRTLGITGGEPTLFGEDFIALVRHVKNWLPTTSLHILSNGRYFSNPAFADAYAAVNHPDVMLGIPIYSEDPALHDYVVQADGAFDETVRGVLNLKRLGQKVEIRVVLHKQTAAGLPKLAEYIARNLLFVDQVALMGLEMMGFTRANLDALWIDPIEYKRELSQAARILSAHRIPVSIYNLPLCLVDPDVYPFYVKSISDWKNEYAPECEPCKKKSECGGFFSSAIKYGYSKSIRPFCD